MYPSQSGGNEDDKFKVDQRITVDGYQGRVFTVLLSMNKIVFNKGLRRNETTYSVKDIESGEILTAYHEDMKIYTDEQERQDEINYYKEIVDRSLDLYRDWLSMYKMFGDKEYKDKADNVIKLLHEMADEKIGLFKGDLQHEKKLNH